MAMEQAAALLAEIRACTVYAAQLAAGPRVHESGIPWDDASGERLRDWTGLTPEIFYDAARVALVPMGFCYPGTGTSGDLPPRPECAPTWHDRVIATLPIRRLTLLVGSYAQARYLPLAKGQSLSERVADFKAHLPSYFPLPHPSWRSAGWMKRNPWFEADLLPVLKREVRARTQFPN